MEHVQLMSAHRQNLHMRAIIQKKKLQQTNTDISDSYQFFRDEAFVECCVCERMCS